MSAAAEARCYTLGELLARLQLSRAVFYRLKAAGGLPFVEELRPRLGKRPRYRADLVDRYLTGDYGRTARSSALRLASRAR